MSKTTIISELRHAMRNHSLISLCGDSDSFDDAAMGYILAITPSSLLFQRVLVSGLDGGYEVWRLTDVHHVACEGRFEQCQQTLHENRDELYREAEPPELEGENLHGALLRQAMENKLFVDVIPEDPAESLQGFVLDLGNDFVKIQIVDSYGEEDAQAIISLDSVRSVHYNSPSNQRREFLHRKQANNTGREGGQ